MPPLSVRQRRDLILGTVILSVLFFLAMFLTQIGSVSNNVRAIYVAHDTISKYQPISKLKNKNYVDAMTLLAREEIKRNRVVVRNAEWLLCKSIGIMLICTAIASSFFHTLILRLMMKGYLDKALPGGRVSPLTTIQRRDLILGTTLLSALFFLVIFMSQGGVIKRQVNIMFTSNDVIEKYRGSMKGKGVSDAVSYVAKEEIARNTRRGNRAEMMLIKVIGVTLLATAVASSFIHTLILRLMKLGYWERMLGRPKSKVQTIQPPNPSAPMERSVKGNRSTEPPHRVV